MAVDPLSGRFDVTVVAQIATVLASHMTNFVVDVIAWLISLTGPSIDTTRVAAHAPILRSHMTLHLPLLIRDALDTPHVASDETRE